MHSIISKVIKRGLLIFPLLFFWSSTVAHTEGVGKKLSHKFLLKNLLQRPPKQINLDKYDLGFDCKDCNPIEEPGMLKFTREKDPKLRMVLIQPADLNSFDKIYPIGFRSNAY